MIEIVSEFVFKAMKCLNQEVAGKFVDVQDALLSCFVSNSKCFATLKSYAQISQVLSKSNPQVRD